MNNIKISFKAIKEMHRLEKRILPCCIGISVIGAFSPFINIWFSSKIIDVLEAGADIKKLIALIAGAVCINFVLMFLNHFLGDMFFMYRNQMYNREIENIAKKLYSTEYKRLEDSDFKELVHKHSEAQNRVYSAFCQFAWMIRDFVSGLITLAIAVVILIPLFKIGFTKTGESFFEKPVFLLTIFGSIFAMVAVILMIALKMNKAHFEAGNTYSRLDRLFYYFLDMFADYKTGKEIRLYNEQELIRHNAVDVLLTDGEKLLKKISLRTAKSSSIVAILGAVVGFGVYLFIGAKGLYGLFGIGSLVLYCGSFMQIINGVMKLASTFGKTAEMCPLVNYYFEILDTKDCMLYGDKVLNFESYEIEFRNVFFKYPGCETYALENINLTIHNGEHLAVVGRNGSGKTTFIK
ncbi:MAG: ATP-binding cassette domain-containing protein, partial [Eubacterium sp.]